MQTKTRDAERFLSLNADAPCAGGECLCGIFRITGRRLTVSKQLSQLVEAYGGSVECERLSGGDEYSHFCRWVADDQRTRLTFFAALE